MVKLDRFGREIWPARPAQIPFHRARPRGPWPLWLWAGLVAAALLLPITYLLIRALEADPSAWASLLRARTLEAIARTVLLAVAVAGASLLIAVPLAWLTVRSDVPGRRLWAALTPLPLVIPSYVSAYLFIAALGPRGMAQQFLQPLFGIERLPELYGFPGALIVLTLLSYPYIQLGVRAALLRMDPAQEESARSLGHSHRSTFWHITLPMLRPSLSAGCLLIVLYVVRDFGAVAMLRYDTLTRIIYTQYQSFDRAHAALTALLAVGVTLAILMLDARARDPLSKAGARAATGADRPPSTIKLGVWRWPAFAFCAIITFWGLVLPVLSLGYWLVRGLRMGEGVPELGLAVANSALASALGAMAAVLAALPLAVLIVRHVSRGTWLLERMTYVCFALPGIVIALALVFFGANQVPWLYQTLPMLVLAYTILFVPQAVSSLRVALLHIPPHLEEAARGLGCTSREAFARISLPLMRPGVLAGASLVFLTVMKELPATLILSPIGFRTLAVAVWSAISEAFFAAAAAPALLIILLSSVPMTLLVMRERPGDTGQ